MCSRIFRYNGTTGHILRTIKAKDKGLLDCSLHKTGKSSLLTAEHRTTEDKTLITGKFAENEKTLARAKEKEVKKVIAVSPYLVQIDVISPTPKVLSEMSVKYGCLLIYYSQNEVITGGVTKLYDVGI